MGSTASLLRPDDVRQNASSLDEATTYAVGLRQLVAFFRGKGIRPDEATDLANETVLRTLVHLKRHGRTQADLGPLARTIARNLLTERYRRATPVTVPLGEATDVASDDPGPADEAIAAERRQAVRAALGTLQPRHRRVVEMWMDGATPADIARKLGIKRNAADALLHRARRSLATRLKSGSVSFGIFGFAPLRLRSAMRRLAEYLPTLDPGGAMAAAATAVAAASMVAILSASPQAVRPDPAPNTTPASETRSGTDRISRESVGSTVRGDDTDTREPQRAEDGTEIEANIQDHRAGAGTTQPNPTTGEDEELGVSIWHDRDEEDRGTTGPMLDDATDAACAAGCPKVKR